MGLSCLDHHDHWLMVDVVDVEGRFEVLLEFIVDEWSNSVGDGGWVKCIWDNSFESEVGVHEVREYIVLLHTCEIKIQRYKSSY